MRGASLPASMCGGRTVIDSVDPETLAASSRKLSERGVNVMVLGDSREHCPYKNGPPSIQIWTPETGWTVLTTNQALAEFWHRSKP